MTALLVDDEAYFRRFVGQVLRKEQLGTVLEASDGREAVQLFKAHSPAIVILDINMPRQNGVETLSQMRQISAETPIIMLTSIAEEAVVEECVKRGATFFIRKDVPAHELSNELSDSLAEYLDTHSSL